MSGQVGPHPGLKLFRNTHPPFGRSATDTQEKGGLGKNPADKNGGRPQLQGYVRCKKKKGTVPRRTSA